MSLKIPYKTLLCHNEIPRVRIGIRNYYSKKAVSAAYDSIGQLLSHARIQLALAARNDTGGNDNLKAASDSIGDAIRDLREMCRLFYSDESVLSEKSFLTVTSWSTLRRTAFTRYILKTDCDLSVFILLTSILGSKSGHNSG